jgi:hypothetical protein
VRPLATLVLRGSHILAWIPADFRKTVVFLGQDVSDTTLVFASAFWVINVQSQEVSNQYRPAYLVTATHVLEELEKKHLTTVRIRVNLKDGQSQWLSPISIARWKAHPDNTADVSFLKHEIRAEWDHEGWPTSAFVTEGQRRRPPTNSSVARSILAFANQGRATGEQWAKVIKSLPYGAASPSQAGGCADPRRVEGASATAGAPERSFRRGVLP